MTTKLNCIKDTAYPEEFIPELNKKPGVYYAFTKDGVELPVLDITHKAFELKIPDLWKKQLSTETNMSADEFRDILNKSLLGRGLVAAHGTFLPGMATYLLKLGPENLGSFANDIDRRLAQAVVAVSARLRVEHMARLLADHLISVLPNNGNKAVHFLNIAGGTAMDSLNALILISKEHKEYLIGRKIAIHVLDRDTEGPLFAERSLTALSANKAPFEGLDIQFHHVPYDWAQTDQLRQFVSQFSPANDIVVASSEGGLFEYGTDEHILSNLRELNSHVTFMVGSVYRADKASTKGVAVIPRKLDEFKNLIKRIEWTVIQVLEAPLSYNVALTFSSTKT